jgi:hypothetical protein
VSIDPVSLAIMVALNAATMAITASRSIEGPRLSDLSVTVADYGTPLPNFVGTRRIEAPVFYAEPIRETRNTRKGKGGKYREYSYSGTFGVIVADHEIEAIVRVWLDRRLAYSVSGAGPIEDSLGARTYMRFYLGTETQSPNERMLATIEAEEGVGTCPAYLGVAYIFFEELPLEPFGNRFPMTSVEARRTALPAFPSETYSVPAGISPGNIFPAFSHDYKRFIYGNSGRFEIWDNETRTRIINAQMSVPIANAYAYKKDGTILAVGEFFPFGHNQRFYNIGANGLGSQIIFEPDLSLQIQSRIFVFYTPNPVTGEEDERWITQPSITVRRFYSNSVEYDMNNLTGIDWRPEFYFQDRRKNIWAVGRRPGLDATTAYFYRFVTVQDEGDNFFFITGLPEMNVFFGQVEALGDPVTGNFMLFWGALTDARMLVVDYRDGTVLKNIPTQLALNEPNYRNWKFGSPTIYGRKISSANFAEMRLSDLEIVREVTITDWGTGNPVANIYDPYNQAIIAANFFDQNLSYLFLDRTTNGNVTLGSIASLISGEVRLPSGDYSYSALDQPVTGFSWTQGAAKQILDPLFTLYDSMLVPDGFTLRGVKRGAAVVGDPISFENFARTSDTEPTEPYKVDVISESDLPRRLFLTFADLNGEQQPNTATAQRAAQSVLTVRELSYDMTTLALTAEEAQQLTERALRRPWISSLQGENKLPPNYLWVLPGDVIDLKLDEDTTVRTCIKRKVISPNRTITLRWEQDRAAVAQLAPVPPAEAVGRPPPEVFSPRDTVLFILDTPLVTDTDDDPVPFLYLAATPNSAGDWPGADVQESLTGAPNTFEPGFFLFDSTKRATAGVTVEAVPDAVSTVPDLTTQIRVLFYGETPTIPSATMEELLANPLLNLAAIGRPDRLELVQFMTADLESDGEWLFSGLLRGRRGTERHTATHQTGDYFVLFSNTWEKRAMGASRLGQTNFYQAITYGRTNPIGGPEQDTFEGEANRPLSVANIQIVKDYTTGTFDVTWQRRTRIGGSNIDGQDVPLGEASELYNVRVMNGATVVRSEQVTSPQFEYTAYEQIEDFGSERSTITVQVEQVSPALNLAGPTVQATG